VVSRDSENHTAVPTVVMDLLPVPAEGSKLATGPDVVLGHTARQRRQCIPVETKTFALFSRWKMPLTPLETTMSTSAVTTRWKTPLIPVETTIGAMLTLWNTPCLDDVFHVEFEDVTG